MLSQAALDCLLRFIDANPFPGEARFDAVVEALEQRGRYYEAMLIAGNYPFAIRELKCGHMHVRDIGCQYIISELGPCAWTGGEES